MERTDAWGRCMRCGSQTTTGGCLRCDTGQTAMLCPPTPSAPAADLPACPECERLRGRVKALETIETFLRRKVAKLEGRNPDEPRRSFPGFVNAPRYATAGHVWIEDEDGCCSEVHCTTTGDNDRIALCQFPGCGMPAWRLDHSYPYLQGQTTCATHSNPEATRTATEAVDSTPPRAAEPGEGEGHPCATCPLRMPDCDRPDCPERQPSPRLLHSGVVKWTYEDAPPSPAHPSGQVPRVDARPADERPCYILCCRHSRSTDYLLTWWGPDRRGYTFDLDRAGIYPESEARAIVGSSLDRVVPVSDVKAFRGAMMESNEALMRMVTPHLTDRPEDEEPSPSPSDAAEREGVHPDSICNGCARANGCSLKVTPMQNVWRCGQFVRPTPAPGGQREEEG